MTATEKQKRICNAGHKYYKTSDCPVCPICEKKIKPENNFPALLPAPARRALQNKGITTLQKLAKFTEDEILSLHGIGKSSIPILIKALHSKSLSFKKESSMKKAKDVNEYILSFPPSTQKLLKQMRTTIKKAAPDAEELISYGMPAYKLNGPLVYFGGYESHIGFYAIPSGISAFKKELSKYKGGKGSVKFPMDEPLPLNLVTNIVKFRVKENNEKIKIKKMKTK